MTVDKVKLLGMLGLARRAGKVSLGTDMVCIGMQKHKAKIVVIASDASSNTRERIEKKCSYYSVKCASPDVSSEELSSALGKECALMAVSVDDDNLARAIEKILVQK